MSRGAWNLIKSSKQFYIVTYRRAGTALFYSLLLNLLLGVIFYFLYFSQSAPDFYATNGVTPPIRLTPLDDPNKTSVPLLPEDPANDDNDEKAIPQ